MTVIRDWESQNCDQEPSWHICMHIGNPGSMQGTNVWKYEHNGGNGLGHFNL